MTAYDAKKVRKYDQPTEADVSAIIERLEGSDPALRRLNAETLDQARGFEITKERILELIGDADERQRRKTIQAWKLCLQIKHGITVVYAHKIKGYRYPTAEDELFGGHDKRAAAIERKAKQEWLRLAIIRSDDMTDLERRRRVAVCEQMNDTAGKINAQRQQAALWSKRPETLPRIGSSG